MASTMDTADNSVAIDLHRQHISTNMERSAINQYPDIGIALYNSISNENKEWTRTASQKVRLTKQYMDEGMMNPNINAYTTRSYDTNPRFKQNYSHDRRKNQNRAMVGTVK